MTELELIISRLFERLLDVHERERASSLASSLATSYGMLGLSASAELARQIPPIFDEPSLGVPGAVRLSTLIDDIRAAAATTVSEIKNQTNSGCRIAIVGEECEMLDTLIWVALAQGLGVIFHSDSLEVSDSDIEAVRSVLVLVGEEGPVKSRSMIRSIRELFPTQPIVAVSSATDYGVLAPMAESVSLILPHSKHPVEIIAELRAAMARSAKEASIGLIGTPAKAHFEGLIDRGFTVALYDSVAELIDGAANNEFRGVIIGDGEEGFSEQEILRLLRTNSRTRSTVVALMTADPTALWAQNSLRNGADLTLSDEIDQDDLSLWMRSLLTRRSEIEPADEGQILAGLTPWDSARVVIERILMASFRRHQPVGIGTLRLSSIWVDDQSLDDAISSEFRNEDVITRVDDETMVIVLQGVDARIMSRRLSAIHAKYKLGDHSARGAVVEFPADGRSLDDLVSASVSLIDSAAETNGPEVVWSGWEHGSMVATDILMVDPDKTLGEVLASALRRRGMSVEVQPDAISALDRLTGDVDRPLPKVVLLELDLLGLDGLQFLRSLRDAGVMRKIKVIVLSSRSRESDLRQAFEFGVDDYVSKPFSAPLLMHRLDRVLKAPCD